MLKRETRDQERRTAIDRAMLHHETETGAVLSFCWTESGRLSVMVNGWGPDPELLSLDAAEAFCVGLAAGYAAGRRPVSA